MANVYTIEVDNEEEMQKLTSIAQLNGINISVRKNFSAEVLENSGKNLATALDKVAQKGGLQSFGDASEWQSATRKDRQMPGR